MGRALFAAASILNVSDAEAPRGREALPSAAADERHALRAERQMLRRAPDVRLPDVRAIADVRRVVRKPV